jgi:ABC-type phosphate transport system substrate-binding protein
VTDTLKIGYIDTDVIATDAVGFVVSNSTRLKINSISQADINALATAGVLASAPGAHLYCREVGSGTRDFVAGFAGGTADVSGTAVTWGSAVVAPTTITYVASAQEMQTAVAADPFGIGYLGLGEANPNAVTILPYRLAGGGIQKFDRPAVANAPTAASGWAIQRPLFARNVNGSGVAGSEAKAFMDYVHGDFQKSLIFKASFFPPKPLSGYGMAGGGD